MPIGIGYPRRKKKKGKRMRVAQQFPDEGPDDDPAEPFPDDSDKPHPDDDFFVRNKKKRTLRAGKKTNRRIT